MEQKNWLVKTGDFFFKYRNFIFPILLVALFLTNNPPSEYLGSERLEDIVDWIAVLMVTAGLVVRCAVIGFKYIKRGGLNKKVYAENLVTDGFFGACRNPLYVGNFLIYTGVLLKHGAGPVLVIGVAFFAFVYTAIVAAEEYFLRNAFGVAYEAYCKDVPRWIPKFSRLKEATKGMKFNLKRALLKDYGTIANAIVILTLLELLERNDAVVADNKSCYIIIAITRIVGLAVRIAKKRKLLVAT